MMNETTNQTTTRAAIVRSQNKSRNETEWNDGRAIPSLRCAPFRLLLHTLLLVALLTLLPGNAMATVWAERGGVEVPFAWDDSNGNTSTLDTVAIYGDVEYMNGSLRATLKEDKKSFCDYVSGLSISWPPSLDISWGAPLTAKINGDIQITRMQNATYTNSGSIVMATVSGYSGTKGDALGTLRNYRIIDKALVDANGRLYNERGTQNDGGLFEAMVTSPRQP